MKKHLLYASLITLTAYSGFFPAVAAQSQTIQEVCISSQLKCLTEIDQRQPLTRPQSFEWYQMEMLRQQSLFELERFDELIAVLAPWQNYDNLPHSFALSVAIHKAKMQLMLGDKVSAHNELNYAVNVLSEITNFNGNPMLIVMMANALLVMDEYDKGYQTLVALEAKYQRSPDPLLKREMYANLGHLASRLKKHEESIAYRKLSLEGAEGVGNTQQVGVAHFNLAAAYAETEQYFEAITHYQHAIDSARQSFDQQMGTKAKIRLIECYLAIGNYANAKEVIATINLYNIAKYDEQRYQALLEQLNKKSPTK
ncbi:tetratricopeptide repeat protein [Thalassotalea sp. LPB0316]|uniref:tetratricopeptide repeat protein n=1 Tax=Thalassotalea sp. LPB0316 TaxID=2769490 RepID=UPI0018673B46|nr:tetratricopeptide repeat protein [Thalassotalea sp. LPB0316]QOL24496.1 tetratricopeptide repeat protein [Thalassotalea sp. LPB0316]